MINYAKAIPEWFDILDKEGKRVPFTLKPVQQRYLELLEHDYPTMQGIRENDLKARQQGFSSLIDAIFLVDFITTPNVGAQIISHKEEETKPLIKRVNFYLDSFLEKQHLTRKHLLKTDSMDYLENLNNGSYIFIGTAGAKTLGRGGTLINLHWSEVGFYPNTTIINAEKLVTGAEQQVAMGVGKIFRESTGNMQGDFWEKEYYRGKKGESSFKSRFFPWFNDPEYSLEDPEFILTAEYKEIMDHYGLNINQMAWYHKKSTEFQSKTLFLREYPTVDTEAFLASGQNYFDPDVLKWYKDHVKEPIQVGNLAYDGSFL